MCFPAQLSAGGVDVGAQLPAHSGVDVVPLQHGDEFFDLAGAALLYLYAKKRLGAFPALFLAVLYALNPAVLVPLLSLLLSLSLSLFLLLFPYKE